MKKNLEDLGGRVLAGAVVALRADFNVPMEGSRVADSTRIERTIPTIQRLGAAGARVVVLSHLGRPGGQVLESLTLKPVARCLEDHLGQTVRFVSRGEGAFVRDAVERLDGGSVLVLENTRFLSGETSNDPDLAADWAQWADHFVMDAFGTAHRAHASTDGLPRAIRARGGDAVAGELMEAELSVLGAAVERPDRPFVAVLGGAKVSGKIGVMKALLPKVDALLVGGAMANTFFCAMGMETGRSLVETDKVGVAAELLVEAGPRLVLPVDCTAASNLASGAATRTADRSEISPQEVIGDIGPATAELFANFLADAATVVWNGPMGAFEIDGFGRGTRRIAQAMAEVADLGATVIIGGGDSVAAVASAGVATRISHISTGGGASLDFLAGRALPGVAALSERPEAPFPHPVPRQEEA